MMAPADDNLLAMRNFGALLGAYIDEAGYSSDAAFASTVGTTAMTISYCKRGKRGPEPEALEVWANALKLTGQARSDFIRAGWRATAERQKRALPWIQYQEKELKRSRVLVNEAQVELQRWMRRAGQLEGELKIQGLPVPPFPVDSPPPEGGARS